MLLKVPTHPLFDYLQTKVRNKQFSFNPEHININMSQGPLGFTDTRFVGDNFHFDCHSTLVLPHALIPVTLPESPTSLTVSFPGVVKEDMANYLTYCYSGRLVVVL